MSLSTVVTVHCDGCGFWLHMDEQGSVAKSTRTRRRAGWVTFKDRIGVRRDYCPMCIRTGRAAQS